MVRVLFYDIVCPIPYDWVTLHNNAQGGSESTVTRVAEGLAKGRNYNITIAQHNRFTNQLSPNGVMYVGINPKLFKNNYDVVVVLRDTLPLALLRPHYRNARMYLWCHDLSHTWLTEGLHNIQATQTELVAVSDFHKTNLQEAMKAICDVTKVPRVHRVYNPVCVPLIEQAPYDKHKLVFLSSPHKGLDYTLHLFNQLVRVEPKFRLVTLNPGYLANPYRSITPNVTFKAPSSPDVALGELSTSLCLFYPNISFPETFGLVLGEANSLGVPALAHRFGAAAEVLGGPPQVMDCREQSKVIDTVLSWSDGNRPVVAMNPQFSLATVLGEWNKILA